MQLTTAIDHYLHYLKAERGLAANTLMAYAQDLQKFLAYAESQKLLEITVWQPPQLLAFVGKMAEQKSHVNSQRRLMVTLRQFFRFLNEEQHLPNNPMHQVPMPKVKKKLPQVMSLADIEKLLAAMDLNTDLGKRDLAMLELMYAAGLRVSELTTLKPEQLKLDGGYVRVMGKGSKQRIVPMGEPAQAALRCYIEQVRPRWLKSQRPVGLFLNRQGGQLSRQAFWQNLKRYARIAGISSAFTPHSLRHSFATHLLQHGADLAVLQGMLGHADLTTTQIYTQVATTQLKKVHQKYHPRG